MQNAGVLNQEILINPELYHPWDSDQIVGFLISLLIWFVVFLNTFWYTKQLSVSNSYRTICKYKQYIVCNISDKMAWNLQNTKLHFVNSKQE